MKKKKHIFISYSHKDKEFTNRLVDDLRSQGLDVWIDDGEIKIGDYLIDRISDGIKSCLLFICIVSKNYKTSKWCKHEIKIKLSDEVGKGKVFILPVRIDDTDPEELLPAKVWADFRDPESYADSLRISYFPSPIALIPKVNARRKRYLRIY